MEQEAAKIRYALLQIHRFESSVCHVCNVCYYYTYIPIYNLL